MEPGGLDIEAERARAIARVQAARRKELTDARAAMLAHEVGKNETLEDAARRTWPHFSEDDIQEIVAAHGRRREGQRKVTLEKADAAGIQEWTKRLVQRDPHATSREIWERLQTHINPGIKKSSWQTMYFGPARKELGITTRKGPAPKHWSEIIEEAGIRVRLYERTGSEAIWASVTVGGKKSRLSMRTSDRELAEQRARSFARKMATAPAGDGSGIGRKAASMIKRLQTAVDERAVYMIVAEVHGSPLGADDAAAVKQAAEARINELSPEAAAPSRAPERSPDPPQAPASGGNTVTKTGAGIVIEPGTEEIRFGPEEREVIELSTPGGTLKATEQGSGWWHVTFEGPVERALLNELLADMLRPILGEKEAA